MKKAQYQLMILSDHYLIFSKEDKDPSKRWEIIIPLDSIIVERWAIQEKVRRKQILGGGDSIGDFGAIGSGVVHDTGKAHHLVIPYMDENGIPQEPRFGVSSFRGKAIREWATKLYQQVVKEKTDSVSASSQIHHKNRLTMERLLTRSATCKACGLTARNKEELEDHVNHAHKRD